MPHQGIWEPNNWVWQCRGLATHSPDLTPLNSFLWRYLTQQMYKTNSQTFQDVKDALQTLEPMCHALCSNLTFNRRSK
ncbi:hypothetical protein TNCV_253541 [Trichonephila clavipes]|nr:hypothetical protein TNCV_253541 [Trichonephila clavipes]